MLNIFGARRAAGTLALGGLAAAVIACGNTETIVLDVGTPEPLTSFYIEVRIEVTPGDMQGADSVFPPDGTIVNELQWWFEAPDRFRRESLTLGPPYLAGSSLAVSDGENWISYDANLNRYQSTPAPRFPVGTVPAPLSGILIGPLPNGTVEAWADSIRIASPRFDVRLIRVDELLGRRVGVYEFSDVGVYLDTEGTVAAGSTSLMWFDQSSGLVLKYESPPDSTRQHVIAEITRLVVNSGVDDDRFTFEPPAGAVEAEISGVTSMSGSILDGPGPANVHGLLDIVSVPAGISGGESSTSLSMDIVDQAENTWTWPDGRALRVRQKLRVSGLPEFYLSGEQVHSSAATHSGSYFVLRSDDGEMITVAWQNGDVMVVMDGLAMDLDELINVADSMVRPGTETLPEG